MAGPKEHVGMKIALAADHGGFALKQEILDLVRKLGHEVVDLGANQYDAADDYPDFARYVSQAIQHGQADRGIVLCGSGVGACIAANKHKGVRASVCHDTYSAAQGVEHDDMNVLCLGARIVGPALAAELIRAFLGAGFQTEPRFRRRLEKVMAIEAAN
jgi:ribose 5-phosphate isomerase B